MENKKLKQKQESVAIYLLIVFVAFEYFRILSNQHIVSYVE